MLETSDTRLRVVLIELAGRRRVAAAVPALKQAADETDEGVRLAAIKALGETVGPADLTLLTGRLVAPRSAAETAAARDALRAACRRMPDRDACAETLAAALAPAPAEAKRLLLDIFVAVGGPRAVKAVSESVKDPDEGVRDAAVRALGEWRSQEAAVELLALYKAEAEEKERTRVFRGFNHIVRSLGFPKEERLALTREALAAARIDAERKELIETYANVPAVETFPHLAPLYAVPALKEDACAAAVRIGDRIVRFQPAAVAAAMKQVLDAEPGPETAAKAKKLHEQGGGKP
jgi:hypothetical protein